MSNCYCYYYDEQHNRCNCYVNENLNELLAKNVKLRELVADMWSYINAPVNQRNSLKERLAIYDDLADRMRELGVEVDG